MISVNNIKFISKEMDKTSFYFTKGNILFLFEVTEASVEWFTTWKTQFKDIDKIVVVSSIYHTNKDNPYLKEIIRVLSEERNKLVESIFISGESINNGKPNNTFSIKCLFKEKVFIETKRDITAERIDFILYDNIEPDISLYYSGINIGRRVSKKLDLNTWENSNEYYRHYTHIIFNIFNKHNFLNISNYLVNLITDLHKRLDYPYKCTLVGLDRVGNNQLEEIEKKLKNISFNGVGKASPEYSIYRHDHDGEDLS